MTGTGYPGTVRCGLVVVLVLIAALAVVMPAAQGAVLTIDNTPNAIATGISTLAASGDPEDTLILNPGTYFEHDIAISKNIIIRANTSFSGTAANTIIDAQTSDRIFDNTGGHSLAIDTLTLQNGRRLGGGAIYNNGGTVTITGSTITGCSATYGGAIYNNGGTVTITGSTITGCSAISGGAIFNVMGATLVIDSSQLTNCQASTYMGGAILSDGALSVTIRNGSVISGCTAMTDGGAIWSSGPVTVQDSEISHCTATNNGGAIYLTTGSTLIAHHATFDTDTATNAAGGAIYAVADTPVTIDQNSVFTGCMAHNSGGAIEAFGTTDITDTTFTSCSAPSGGAIQNSGILTLDRVTFSTCSATGASGTGGAIASGGAGSSVTITSSAFTGCSAHHGGGIYNNGIITITSSTFTGCTATNNGGAIASSGQLTITSSTFTGNAASATGSAISSTGSGSSVHFSRFYQNLNPVVDVVHSPTSVEAQNNWWGTSNDPGVQTGGYVNYDPWLVLGATAAPSSITTTQISAVRANLTFNSDPADTSAGGIFVPDGIPVAFSRTGGTGSVLPAEGNITSGTNATTFTPAYAGTATVMAQVDDEAVPVTILVGQGAPAITGITPSTGINTTGISITNLAGSSFMNTGTTTVNLTRAGYANITAINVVVADNTRITCTLPITGAEAGAWNVVVTNLDGQEGVLPGGFTVTVPVPTPVPTTATIPATTLDTSGNDDGFPSGGSVAPAATAGTPLLMTVTMNIGGDSKAGKATVTGTKLTGLVITGTVQSGPGTNMTAPPGIVVQYLTLEPAGYGSITNAVINFSVPQSWLDENHIAPGSIVLYHLSANGWEALPTTVLSTKDGTVYFSGQTTGFSLFAIAGTPTALTPELMATAPRGITESVVQTPAPVAQVKSPATTQTTAPPAATPKPASPSPLLNIVLVIAAIGVLAGGGFMVRRWWIRRQNPALFEDF